MLTLPGFLSLAGLIKTIRHFNLVKVLHGHNKYDRSGRSMEAKLWPGSQVPLGNPLACEAPLRPYKAEASRPARSQARTWERERNLDFCKNPPLAPPQYC